ncbi:MAG: TonB-dependent receptor [Alphaproteobacteria bacterium]|nr:TonB-dependent receptor [Alphaproteobacteria bacterium]
MYPTRRRNAIKPILLGSSLLTGLAMIATSPVFAQDVNSSIPIETVTVTGYRASLEDATNAKRSAVSFSDSVFAEDIGKFPDSNIAESLNRIPGVTITRDSDGEGVNVSIRGLGTNFTKILLNNAQISVATSGPIDQQNNNREVDLNMFPTELFTQLTVSKSPTADQLEGGAAGTLNMRSLRPFDKEGPHLTYTMQGSDYSQASSMGEHGTLIASDTWGPFGALVGVTYVNNEIFTKGWETGNGGYVSSSALTAAQCGPATNTITPTGCDTLGGNSYTLPATVPAGINYTGGPAGPIVAGQTIDAAFILKNNPGLTTLQFSNGLLPKLPRPMFESGSRDRYNSVVSLEYRPSDDLHFYLDLIGGHVVNVENRTDISLGVRAGSGSVPIVPINMQVDANSLITSATLLGAIYGVEARPYVEKGSFMSANPGMSWQLSDMLHVDFQLNASRSSFIRDAPTFFVVTAPPSQNAAIPGATPPAGGSVVTYQMASPYPTAIPQNVNLNDPASFQWNNGLIRLQDERRITKTQGAHLDVTYGGDEMNVKVGFAYDDAFRQVIGVNPDAQYQAAVCGDNPSVFLPPPNTAPPCQGITTSTPNGVGGPGGYPTYPGYGTGYTAGFAPLVWQGSLVPGGSLPNYVVPGPTGFATVNFKAIEAATHYAAMDKAALAAIGTPNAGSTVTYPYSLSAGDTGTASGSEEERNVGLYGELNGVLHLGRDLKYNLGLRWVQTLQNITSPVPHVNPLNATLADGGKYPNTYTFLNESHDYAAFLPSVNLVYEVADDFQVRLALSRTMSRPNVNSMIDVVSFNDVAVTNASKGNPNLKPYFSNNIDLGVEFYTGGEGYISADIFRKSISGFTVTQSFNQTFAYLAPYGITYGNLSPQQQSAVDLKTGGTNGSNANALPIIVSEQFNARGLLTINGMEFDYVQPLDFLLERYGLKGFGFTGNVTIVDQKSSGSAPAIAGGVAPLTYNMTAYYENNGAMVRFSYAWNDKSYVTGATGGILGLCLPNVAAVSSGCTAGPYFINAPHGQLDMSSSFELSRLFGDLPSDPYLTFDIQNLNKAKLITYEQYTNAINTYYNPGTVFLFGVRGSF